MLMRSMLREARPTVSLDLDRETVHVWQARLDQFAGRQGADD
jgi:hypothetical protein